MTLSLSGTRDEKTVFINPTMHMSHITQYTIENKNVHIFVLDGIYCGILYGRAEGPREVFKNSLCIS